MARLCRAIVFYRQLYVFSPATQFRYFAGREALVHENPKNLISDEAVINATGRNWDWWFDLLDQAGVLSFKHADIVKWIAAQNITDSFWWHQTIAGEYQKARGKREVGQKENTQFQASTQKSFALDLNSCWDFITTDPARKIWLGSVQELPLVKGATFATEEGLLGEVRGIKHENYIRLQLQKPGEEDATTLIVYLIASGSKTAIRFLQEKLNSQEERNTQTAHWKNVLTQLADLLKT